MAVNFRKRLESSDLLAGLLGRMVAGYLRLCNRTTRWTHVGRDDLQQALAQGPVVLVLWHEFSLMAPVHWPVKHGQLSSLRDTSPIGMVSGAVQARFGLDPMAMSAKMSNRAASREILRRVQAGKSIGLTGDGPLGPVHLVKDAALDWARATGCPVFTYAYATRRHKRLNTWDRIILPLPFTRGVSVYQRWAAAVPRRADHAALVTLRTDLKLALDRVATVARTGVEPAQTTTKAPTAP
jgi:lysophospholipid acyltransferase (LPLAT)-like uncharacterized protein